MNETTLKKAWIYLLLLIVGVCVLVYSIKMGYFFETDYRSGVFLVGFVMTVYCFFAYLLNCMETVYRKHAVRIMYVNRWNVHELEYEIVYFVEWNNNIKKYFMGILYSEKYEWYEYDYLRADGFSSLENAKKDIHDDLLRMKEKLKLKEVKEIEVLIVEDELNKIDID